MDERRVTLTLGGRADVVPLGSFLTAAQTFAELLEQLDRELSGRTQGSLDWVVADLELGSVTIVAEAQPRDDTLDIAPLVTTRFVEGLALIERTAERPADFTDQMLSGCKKLVAVLNEGVGRLVVRAAGKQAAISQHVAANVDILVGPRYVSLGAVEGTLETVSLHGRPTFNIYDRVHGRRVRCDFSLEILDRVKDALGQRVLVQGTIHSNARGEPLSVRVAALRRLPDQAERPPRSITGLDPTFTGDSSAAEYVSERREG